MRRPVQCITGTGRYASPGTIRIGWAGLTKVPPPQMKQWIILDRQRAFSRENRSTARAEIMFQRALELAGLGLETAAMEGYPHMAVLHERNQARLEVSLTGAERTAAADDRGRGEIGCPWIGTRLAC
jgi:hypothetical protein